VFSHQMKINISLRNSLTSTILIYKNGNTLCPSDIVECKYISKPGTVISSEKKIYRKHKNKKKTVFFMFNLKSQ
jgi:hypothetical protein